MDADEHSGAGGPLPEVGLQTLTKDARAYLMTFFDLATLRCLVPLCKALCESARNELFVRSIDVKRKGANQALMAILDSNAPNFRDLRFFGKLSDASYLRIASLPRLQRLTLRRFKGFGKVGPEQWRPLGSRLRHLTLANFEQDPLAVFAGVSRVFGCLELLSLDCGDGNQPQEANPGDLVPLPKLQYLFIRLNAAFTCRPLFLDPLMAWVCAMPSLRVLRFDLPISLASLPSWLMRLGRSLPQLHVLYLRPIYYPGDGGPAHWQPAPDELQHWAECVANTCFNLVERLTIYLRSSVHGGRDFFDPCPLRDAVPRLFPNLKGFKNKGVLLRMPSLWVCGLNKFRGTVADEQAQLSITSQTLEEVNALCCDDDLQLL
jgi:hypothetical protein